MTGDIGFQASPMAAWRNTDASPMCCVAQRKDMGKERRTIHLVIFQNEGYPKIDGLYMFYTGKSHSRAPPHIRKPLSKNMQKQKQTWSAVTLSASYIRNQSRPDKKKHGSIMEVS